MVNNKTNTNNNLTIFENPEFGKIRTEIIDGEPWFVGKDVASALGYGKGKSLNNAIARHVDLDDKGVTDLMTPGGKQKTTIINESGLYALIFGSKLDSAKRFKHWVTSEVLPTLRKTGSYSMPMTVEQQVQIVAQGQVQLRKIVDKQEEEIENLQTKVEDLQEQINVIGAYKNSYKYEELKKVISSHVLTLLPGQLEKVLWGPYFYRAIHSALKKHFKVASSKLIQNNQLDNAKDIVYQWKPTKKYIDEKLKELQSKREAGVLNDKRVAALYYWLSTTDNGKNYSF